MGWRSSRTAGEVRALLRLAGPIAAAQLAYMGMGVTDTIMVGHAGPVELAAVALGTGLWNPLFLFSLGTLMAVGTTIAHLYGGGAHERIGPTTHQGLWLALMLAVPVTVALVSMTPLMNRLEVESSIVPVAHAYLGALAWGVVPTFAYLVLRFLSEGLGHTRPVMVVTLLGLALNVAGNYVLIFGKLGLPALGARGCGYATALSWWFMFGLLLWHTRRHGHYRGLALFRRFEGPHRRSLRELWALGYPIGCSIFAESSVFGAIALIIGFLGPTVVAGHQIALNVAAISFMLPLSLGIALTVRVGHAMGRGDASAARRTGFTGIALAGACMAMMAVLILVFATPIVRLYTPDPQVIGIASQLLMFAAMFQISDGLQVSASGALRGLKDTRVPMFITIVAYWVVGLPAGYVLAIVAGLGVDGMWIGLILGLSTAAVLLNLRFAWRARR